MTFSEISTLLTGMASSLDRIRVLASEDQDPNIGIDDHTTSCDKEYWERSYGLFDAVKAIYDMLEGRDAIGSGETLSIGVLNISDLGISAHGPLAVNSYASITETLTVTGAAYMNGGLTIGAGQALSFGVGSTFSIDDVAGITFEDTEFSYPSDPTYKAMSLVSGNLTLGFPEDWSFYDALGYGGGFRFDLGDRVAASISAAGRLCLGGCVEDDPDDTSGIHLLVPDETGSAGIVEMAASTLEADNRTSLNTSFVSTLEHLTATTVRQELKFATVTDTSLCEFVFLVNGDAKASISGAGNLWIDNNLNVSVDATILGALGVTGLSTLGNLGAADVDVSGTLDVIGLTTLADIAADSVSLTGGLITETGQIRAGTSAAHALLGNLSIGSYLEIAKGGLAGYVGVFDDHSAYLSMATTSDAILMGKSVLSVIDEPVVLDLFENSSADRSSIRCGTQRLFLDSNGVVCSTAGTGAVGGVLTGSSKVKGDLSVTVDTGTPVLLASYLAGNTENVANSMIAVKDSTAGEIFMYVYDGTAWIKVTT